MAVKQLPKISDLPEPPDRLVGDQERFDVLTFNSLKAQKKMVNEDLNKTLIPALNEFAVDVNASVDAAALSERNAHDSEEVAKRKAGEASGSAGAAKVSEDNAKVSETNALASKNAAALSAESAEADRIAAEAARDEAEDLANVGYAAENHAGLAKVDGKTTQADAGGVITAKDVAIGGDLGDLASARSLTAKFIKGLGSVDCNTIAENMIASVYQAGTTNGPGFASVLLSFFSSAVMGVQAAFISNSSTIVRASLRSKSANGYSPWSDFLMSGRVGDGIEVNNGIPSVPEMQGATALTAGTSGLVPPAAAGQRESFLTGGGEYKPALSTSGGVMTGSIQINDPANDIAVAPPANTERGMFLGDKNSVVMGGFDVIQRASDNAKYTQFYSKNSSGHITSIAAVTYEDGTRELVADSPLQINDIQIKQVVDGGRRVIVLSGARGNQGHSFRFSPDTGEAYMDGRVIHAKADTAGYADTAGSANALGGKAESALSVAYARDSGAMNGKAESALSVNYANSAGQVYLAGSAVQWVVNLSGPQITVPLGGTYNVVCICFNDSGGKGAVKHYPNIAGGTVIPNAPTDYMVAGLCARVA